MSKSKAPQFKFARHVRRSRLSRDSDVLLEAIVKAIRDKKSRRYLRDLVRCYPVVQNRGNPYRILLDEICKLRAGPRWEPSEPQQHRHPEFSDVFNSR
jgi:hypothetical protein